jgi:hypothetical protein
VLFVITAFDPPGASRPRMQVEPACLHDRDSQAAWRAERLAVTSASPDQTIGSLLLIPAHQPTAAATFSAGDPYRRQRLFERSGWAISTRRLVETAVAASAARLDQLSGACQWHTG